VKANILQNSNYYFIICFNTGMFTFLELLGFHQTMTELRYTLE